MESWKSKWVATAASIWIQCSCGASYAFGIYSSALKSSQGYDQTTLDAVSVFKDIGANAGILSGLFYSTVAASSGSRGRPWLVHLAGAVQIFIGFFFIWAAVTGLVARPPVPLMCLFMFLAAHAQTFFNTANVVTGVFSFPDYGGTIVGILKGFLGLSGPVLIQVYQTLFRGNPSTFLLILALWPTLVSLLLMCLVRPYQINTGYDKKHLDGFSVIALVLAAYLMIVIILENTFTPPPWSRIVMFALLLLILSSPLSVAIKAHKEDLERLSQIPASVDRSPLLEDTESVDSNKLFAKEDPVDYLELPSDAGKDNASSNDKLVPDGEDMNLLQAMRTLNFWLLFIAMVCGMGSGLATVNNISQIGESLAYSTVEINTLVSLWGIWNFLGRFGGGYVSDIFQRARGWARPSLMAVTLATMTAGHLVVASGFPGNLYVGSVVIGVSYGSQWSLMPTITSEIFGVRHMGTIFNTIAAASPVGSYIFSVLLIGYMYDKQAYGIGNSCFGAHCFRLSFFILACVSLFGSSVALALFFRTKRFYKMVVIRRLRRSEKL